MSDNIDEEIADDAVVARQLFNDAREWFDMNVRCNMATFIKSDAEFVAWKLGLSSFHSKLSQLETALESEPEHLGALAALIRLISSLSSAEGRAVLNNFQIAGEIEGKIKAARATEKAAKARREDRSELDEIVKKHLTNLPKRPPEKGGSGHNEAMQILPLVNRELEERGRKHVKIDAVAKRVREFRGFGSDDRSLI